MIFVDPPSYHYYQNKLFNSSDFCLDGRCDPIKRVAAYFNTNGVSIKTSDYLLRAGLSMEGGADFYSFGMLNHRKLLGDKNIKFRAFVIHEPPVVAPRFYKILPELTNVFEKVYIYNTHGDGYSLVDVDQNKLRKFYLPMPYCDVQQPFWDKKDRARKIVIINSIQNPWVFRMVDMTSVQSPLRFGLNSVKEICNPQFGRGELYSKRIEAMVALARLDSIDLYGRGWGEWCSPRTAWLPYWRNRKLLTSIWRGSCTSKFEILSRYTYCLAIENMDFAGFVSEKIIDCLYAGTVPLYFGAKDIADYIPKDAYIDCKNFASWDEMWEAVKDIPEKRIQEMREVGRDFLRSKMGKKFYNSFQEIFGVTEI